jgi:hypothetical protein
MRLPWKLLMAGAAGYAAKYFMDPERGESRRLRAREQFEARVRRTGGASNTGINDQRQGASSEVIAEQEATPAAPPGPPMRDISQP